MEIFGVDQQLVLGSNEALLKQNDFQVSGQPGHLVPVCELNILPLTYHANTIEIANKLDSPYLAAAIRYKSDTLIRTDGHHFSLHSQVFHCFAKQGVVCVAIDTGVYGRSPTLSSFNL